MQFSHALSIRSEATHRTPQRTVRVIHHREATPTQWDHFATSTTGYTVVISPNGTQNQELPYYETVADEAQVINLLGIHRVPLFDGWE